MMVLLDEIHPGEILLEEFMRPMEITGGGVRNFV
jgi:plasmid maintenance system antidote protein VapI